MFKNPAISTAYDYVLVINWPLDGKSSVEYENLYMFDRDDLRFELCSNGVIVYRYKEIEEDNVRTLTITTNIFTQA